jgi:hypothetical protein
MSCSAYILRGRFLRRTGFCRSLLVAAVIACCTSATLSGQEPLRILIEEIQLPVTAIDQFGHFDPSVTTDDLLILEDGVPQQLKSLRHVPANVLLLLDVGVEINKGKGVETSRSIVGNILSSLNATDRVSIMQVSDKAELLQDWTNDFKVAAHTLETKLLSGKHSYLSDGLVAAADRFGGLPNGTRHLVLISDGVETPKGKFDRAEALKRLRAGNIAVHVISYTIVSRRALRDSRTIFRDRDKSTTPDDVVNSLPADKGYERLRDLHKPGGKIADVDPVRQTRVRDYERAMSASDSALKFLSTETGGHFWLPESIEEMADMGVAAARLIDAEYVATYRPKRTVVSSPDGEVRRIEVVSRKVGLTVAAPRYFVTPGKPQ